jgi:hypothetical protein
MAQTSPPAITTPPTAPARSAPSTFASLADAWLAWEEDFAATEMPAVATNVYNNAVDAYNNAVAGAASATAASASQSAAASSAASSASAANAATWSSGGNYSVGAAAYSTSTRLVYRCIQTANGRTTDPSLDTAYWQVSAPHNAVHLVMTMNGVT